MDILFWPDGFLFKFYFCLCDSSLFFNFNHLKGYFILDYAMFIDGTKCSVASDRM